MKSASTIRKIDKFGRISFPFELRKKLKISKGDNLIIYTDHVHIFLEKDKMCYFCGSTENTVEIMKKILCGCCLCELKAL